MVRNLIRKTQRPEFIPVDKWCTEIVKDKEGKETIVYNIPEEDMLFKQKKNYIILPVSRMYGYHNDTDMDLEIDLFSMNSKRCYNDDKMRGHFIHYLNYFEKFYDVDKYLYVIYSRIKYLIDCEELYNKDALIHDIKTYILSGEIYYKVRLMNQENYNCMEPKYNNPNPVLQYDDSHAMALMEISLLSVITIPLLTHFMHKRRVENIKDFLLQVFDIILHMDRGMDICSKLYETVNSSINKSKRNDETLWTMQNIRAKNPTLHSQESVDNIILQIIPKYIYDKNIICFNFGSIREHIKHQVTDIKYEFSFISLSSSRRDEDNNSEFDKFESHMTKQDESLYLQNKVNCQETMKIVRLMYGPFDPDEIKFYKEELSRDRDNKQVIHTFQKELIFNLFYKFFGDTVSALAINEDDYIVLLIAARRILEANGMIVLPYIISSRITKFVSRKNVNKKEKQKLEASVYYNSIKEKYKNPKIENDIIGIIATILSSEFRIIDYHNDKINGLMIPEDVIEFVCEEASMYVMMTS